MESTMKNKLFAAAVLSLILSPALAADAISVNYVFEGDHQVDFSSMARGPLRVGEFTDGRAVDNPMLIAGDIVADKALADIVRDALVQGFLKGNAGLVESEEKLILEGSIVSSETAVSGDTLQITIRTSVQLRNAGRTIWETVLFGRGSAPVAEGANAALTDALDRTIRSLVLDDYFLMEVL
jgi:hypothetical protein